MQKKYVSLGLMSGTSGDGVDASLINSNGVDEFESIKDKYFEYDTSIHKTIHNLKDKINSKIDLKRLSHELSDLERKISLFHAKVVEDLKIDNDFIIGFHGQTIYHNPDEKISLQLGDAQLLHQFTKKKIIYNFRKNDILNGGQGAPLTPIFHQLIAKQKKIKLPVSILNIGGITNITLIKNSNEEDRLFSKDIGPGNCLIDSWIRKNSNEKFDFNGSIAMSGEKNVIIFEQAQELYENRMNKKKISFDVNDFDVSFVRGLSLEDGAKTLTDFTASIISESINEIVTKNKIKNSTILLCGGGRKNETLLKEIKRLVGSSAKLELIDKYKINGDFIESQAFAFLAIRTIKKLPISFPSTTNCRQPSVGGEIVSN
jgi:anhydro-N-acetylmuramic acid kinase